MKNRPWAPWGCRGGPRGGTPSKMTPKSKKNHKNTAQSAGSTIQKNASAPSSFLSTACGNTGQVSPTAPKSAKGYQYQPSGTNINQMLPISPKQYQYQPNGTNISQTVPISAERYKYQPSVTNISQTVHIYIAAKRYQCQPNGTNVNRTTPRAVKR